MRSTPGRALRALILALLLAPAIATVAVADHAYSHRYLVYGRLLDSEGNPVTGVTVNVGMDTSVAVEGLCARQPGTETEAWGETTTRRTTNEYGEFFYCFHVHSLPRRTTSEVRAEYQGVEVAERLDSFHRKSFLVLQLPNATGEATDEFTSTYLVSGRVWYAESQKRVESISVYGDVLQEENVTITFEPATGDDVVVEALTNNYGDFAVRVPIADVTGGRFTVSAAGESQTFDANPTTRATDLEIEVGDPAGSSGLALKILGGVFILGILVVGGYFGIRYLTEARSLAEARAKSTRKRAQR